MTFYLNCLGHLSVMNFLHSDNDEVISSEMNTCYNTWPHGGKWQTPKVINLDSDEEKVGGVKVTYIFSLGVQGHSKYIT